MNRQEYEYFIAESYTVLLQEDIEKYGIVSFLQTHFNIHYIYDSFTFIVTDDGTNAIIKKFNKNMSDRKESEYNLPAQITYSFSGKPILIYYKNAETFGRPTKILNNYSVNGLLIDSKYFWYDLTDSILLNDDLNEFFNHFFMEKIFDITLDYNGSPLMNLIIMELLKGNKDFVKRCFKELNIKSVHDLSDDNMTLFEMLNIN
jgi:hypothetical protein